jgi:RNA polymerase sigma-70 factor (ECF subfamily)
VLAAGQRSSPDSDKALESLCRAYWYPLFAYVRRRAPNAHEAQELTQEFFARLLEKNFVAQADPKRGAFRSFLLTAFKHFLSKEWDKAKAKKRGGGRDPIPLDFFGGQSRFSAEPCEHLTAEQAYDRQWAVTLLDRVMDRLREEFVRGGKGQQFDPLKGFLIGEHSGLTYKDVADGLGVTEGTVKMTVHRMRQRYRKLLRSEIAQTVASPEDVDDEIRSLFAILAG